MQQAATVVTFSEVGGHDGIVRVPIPPTLQKRTQEVQLLDIEFPYTQRHVESGNNVLRYIEDIHTSPLRRSVEFTLHERKQNVRITIRGVLPLTVNRIVGLTKATDGELVERGKRCDIVTLEHEHGFFAPAAFGRPRRSVIGAYNTILGPNVTPLTLINPSTGAVRVDVAKVHFVDEFTIKIEHDHLGATLSYGDALSKKANYDALGWLVTPPFPNVEALTQALTVALNNAVVLSHDAQTGRTKIFTGTASAEADVVGSSGDELAKCLLGFEGTFSGFETVTIRPSNYASDAYSSSTGRPSLAAEVEAAMNRFHIPKDADLLFRGVDGHTWKCTLPKGNYGTGEKLARTIQHMQNLSSGASQNSKNQTYRCAFRILPTQKEGRFVFEADDEFDLLFGDEECTIAHHLGFARVDLTGSLSYAGKLLDAVRYKPNSNIYSADVEPGTDNLFIKRVSRRSAEGAIVEYAKGTLLLKCVCRMSGLPIAHGLCIGDVVVVTSARPAPEGATGKERVSFPFRTARKLKGVVVSGDALAVDASSLSVSIPNVGWMGGRGKFVNIDRPEAPFSIAAFDDSSVFNDSLPPSTLGLSSGITQQENGVLVSPGAVNLTNDNVEISVMAESLTKIDTNVFTSSDRSILGFVPASPDRLVTIKGSTIIPSNAQTITLIFKNSRTQRPYSFNSGRVSGALRFIA